MVLQWHYRPLSLGSTSVLTQYIHLVSSQKVQTINNHIQISCWSVSQPFWPTGSGCARGFLGCFDAAWMIRSWASGTMNPLEVLAERESIYRLLAQTTPENLAKDYDRYGITPTTRYPHVISTCVKPHEVLYLYDTKDPDIKKKFEIGSRPASIQLQRSSRLQISRYMAFH